VLPLGSYAFIQIPYKSTDVLEQDRDIDSVIRMDKGKPLHIQVAVRIKVATVHL
jgi:hypothetical protein